MDRKKESLLEMTAQLFDIPGQAAGAPRVELVGRHEVRMENHRGILSYGREEILISAGRMVVKIRGEALELKAMNPSELLIAGMVAAVELE